MLWWDRSKAGPNYSVCVTGDAYIRMFPGDLYLYSERLSAEKSRNSQQKMCKLCSKLPNSWPSLQPNEVLQLPF